MDMNKKLKDVGCSEGTDVFIVAVDGTPLEKYFYLPNEDSAPPTPSPESDLPVEKQPSAGIRDSKLILEPPESLPLQSGPELIEEPAVELVTSSKLCIVFLKEIRFHQYHFPIREARSIILPVTKHDL